MKNLENSPSNWAEFRNVYISKGGDYQLKLTYYSGDKRDIQRAVNGTEYKQSNLYSGTWDQAATTTIKVKLRKGYNTIRLYNSYGWAPDIDKMEIIKGR